jgi:hypothetical protein
MAVACSISVLVDVSAADAGPMSRDTLLSMFHAGAVGVHAVVHDGLDVMILLTSLRWS